MSSEDKSPSRQHDDSTSLGTGSTQSSTAPEARRVTGTKRVVKPSADAPVATKKARLSDAQRVAKISAAMATILDCLNDDPRREGLKKTPLRYAKAILALTEGYTLSPAAVLGDATFDESHSEMVLVRHIDVFSLCEHHLLPFHGVCHVAYIPTGVVVGLSKIARIVDVFARRMQVQERLTTQIADAIQQATDASGVMVYISCVHMCMAMRGVRKAGAETTTTAVRGRYAEDSEMRREFLSVVTSERRVR